MSASVSGPARSETSEIPLLTRCVIVPGILLLAAIGYAGKFLEKFLNTYAKTHHCHLPQHRVCALGDRDWPGHLQPSDRSTNISVRNRHLRILAQGRNRVARLALRVADMLKLGGISLALVVVEISLSLLLMHALGRAFNLTPKLTSLLAVGSSICGVSAIIAAKGAIDADDEDSTFAIAAILALGALALFTFPLIGHSLHLNDTVFGLWAGLGVDNTAEATATGALYSDAAGKVAVLAKTARNAMIGFVVLAYAIYWAKRGQAATVGNKAAFLWNKFPKFVLGFLLMSLARELSQLQQRPGDVAGEPIAVGLSADLRRSGSANELPRKCRSKACGRSWWERSARC